MKFYYYNLDFVLKCELYIGILIENIGFYEIFGMSGDLYKIINFSICI